MKQLQLYSEPFAKTGNMAAEGARRLLGRPPFGALHTLIREGLQNSMDAGLGDAPIRVTLRIRTLSQDQRLALANHILASLPDADQDRLNIRDAMSKQDLRVLELCDFGTEGLCGPTRADISSSGGEPLNFVNFLRNVGAARDVEKGGGTYGYGKSSLYQLSSCSTIVVDTLTRSNERRLMACHLGEAFDVASRRYTGRHWWGVLDGNDSVEPAIGDVAGELADSLGMLPRSGRETGTSVMVLDPDLPATRNDSADDIIETILWNFWPRMTASTPESRILTIKLEVDGERIPIPQPEEFPPLDLFAAAMDKLRADSSDVIPIMCFKPHKQVGRLVVQRGARASRIGSAIRDETLIPRQLHHVALMRPIELVVKYMEGDPFPDPNWEWAGVFVCSDEKEVEQAFADSEPPAHDDWIPTTLPKGRQKTFVRTAFKRLWEKVGPNSGPASSSAIRGTGPSLAATASQMGMLLDGTPAKGPGKPKGESVKRRVLKKPAITTPRFERLEVNEQGRATAVFVAELVNDASDKGLRLIAKPQLIVDGGSTGNDDLPAEFTPTIASINLDGATVSTGGRSIVVGHAGGLVEVRVETVPGAALGLKLKLQSGEAG